MVTESDRAAAPGASPPRAIVACSTRTSSLPGSCVGSSVVIFPLRIMHAHATSAGHRNGGQKSARGEQPGVGPAKQLRVLHAALGATRQIGILRPDSACGPWSITVDDPHLAAGR